MYWQRKSTDINLSEQVGSVRDSEHLTILGSCSFGAAANIAMTSRGSLESLRLIIGKTAQQRSVWHLKLAGNESPLTPRRYLLPFEQSGFQIYTTSRCLQTVSHCLEWIYIKSAKFSDVLVELTERVVLFFNWQIISPVPVDRLRETTVMEGRGSTPGQLSRGTYREAIKSSIEAPISLAYAVTLYSTATYLMCGTAMRYQRVLSTIQTSQRLL